MQGQYHLQAPLGLNRGSSICLLEDIKEKKGPWGGLGGGAATQIRHFPLTDKFCYCL